MSFGNPTRSTKNMKHVLTLLSQPFGLVGLVGLVGLTSFGCATAQDDLGVGGDSAVTGDAGFDSSHLPDTKPALDTGKSDVASVDTGVDAPKDTFDASSACSYPSSDTQPCGKCGTQTRGCLPGGVWGAFDTCTGEKVGASYCNIGDTKTSDCGTKCGISKDYCDPITCTFNVGVCLGEGDCTASTSETTAASCTVSGEVRTRTCGLTCKWGAYSDCSLPRGWIAMSAAPTALVGRYQHSAVWTGTDMIVWGGYGTYVSAYQKNDGASYRLASNTWKTLAAAPAVLTSGRYLHTAVWSGSQMIVWGGIDTTYRNDGAMYDPSADSWKAMATPTLLARREHGAVWSTTTNEMIVWGGYGSCTGTYCADGAAYDPALNTWTTLPPSPLAARYRPTMIWTGTEVVIWGGYGTAGYLKDGARYDPKTKIWVKFPDPAVEIDGRYDNVGVYSGKEMLIYGGYSGTLVASFYGRNTGARYLPGGSWTSFSIPDDALFGTTARRFASAAWYGNGQLWVWSGGNGNSSTGTALDGGASYDPATDKWATMDVTGAPVARSRASVVWTGKEAIVWGGAKYATGTTFYNDGAVFRP